MRVRAALPFLLACLLVAGLVAGAIAVRQGRDDPARHTRQFPFPTLVAYAGGPGEVVLEWSSDAAGIARWQYRMRDRDSALWETWTDVPGSDAGTNQLRVGGLMEASFYWFEVRPLIADGSGVTPGDPFEWTRAGTLFVGDDGIPWLHAYQSAEGGRTYRIDATDYVIDIPVGMILEVDGLKVRYSDVPFSGGLVDFYTQLRDWESRSYLVFDSGEYVRRVITWPPEGDTDGTAAAAARRVNQRFDEIVASTRLVPLSGLGPSPVGVGGCGYGGAVANPQRNPGLTSDCYALRIARGVDSPLNWDEDTPIGQWDGITVGREPPRVLRVELPSKGLGGSLDSGMAMLTALTHLDLRGNRLEGEIPPELGALKRLQVLYLGGNEGLSGCIPPPMREVPRNDLDSTGLPACGVTAGVDLVIGRGMIASASQAPGLTLGVGESRWLQIQFRRAPWGPVMVELHAEPHGYLKIEPDIVRFGTRQFGVGTPGQSRAVKVTGVRPVDALEIRIRMTTASDPEYDQLAEPTVLATVSPTRLWTIVGGAVGEAILDWDTAERNVERWQYRRAVEPENSWEEVWTDVPNSNGSTRSHRLTGLDPGWSIPRFEVRPWTAAGPGRPSNTSTVVAADAASDGIPIPYLGSDVEAGRRYRVVSLDHYVIDVPPDMRLRFGYQVGGSHSDGIGQQLVDLATGSWIVLWSDGEIVERMIVSPEVVGEPGSVASMRIADEVNDRFDRLLASLRESPPSPAATPRD